MDEAVLVVVNPIKARQRDIMSAEAFTVDIVVPKKQLNVFPVKKLGV